MKTQDVTAALASIVASIHYGNLIGAERTLCELDEALAKARPGVSVPFTKHMYTMSRQIAAAQVEGDAEQVWASISAICVLAAPCRLQHKRDWIHIASYEAMRANRLASRA